MNKKPLGIFIIAYISFFIPAPFLFLSLFPQFYSTKTMHINTGAMMLAIALTLGILFIPLGIKILKKQNIARKSYITLSIIAIAALTGPHTKIFIIPYIYFAWVIIYLTRKKMKEYFT